MRFLLGSFFVLAAAGSAFADPIYALGQSSTAGFSNGQQSGEAARGWDFMVNDAGVVVTQLGVNAGTSTNITLSLWDDSTQTLLGQLVEASTAGTWVFADLSTSIALTQGNTYSVIGWANDVAPWYLFNQAPGPEFTPTGTIQYLNSRFDNTVDANGFPAGTLDGQFGVVDIGYTVNAASTPEPVSMLLVGAGILLVMSLRRQTRKA